MKTSYYEATVVAETWAENELVGPEEVTVRTVETLSAENWSEVPVLIEASLTSDEQPTVDPISEYYTASSDVSLLSESELPDRCQDDQMESEGKGYVTASRVVDTNYTASTDVSLLSESDMPDRCQDDPIEKGYLMAGRAVDIYYTASSDVSLLSETELPDRCQGDPIEREGKDSVVAGHVVDTNYSASSDVSLLSESELPDRCQDDSIEREEKGCVMAGHVAAMRERFESMTRANTPCPDLARSLSPTLDVFRMTPSPDGLG